MDNASPAAPGQIPTPPSGGEQPTAPGTPTGGPRVSRDEMKDLGRLRRSVTDRHIAGVAGGIARHLDIDAIIVRVALVVGVFFGGAGLLLYVGAWLLVPEEGTEDEPLGLDQRSRSMALAGVGILALLAAVGEWAGAFWFPWPLAIVGALVVWFLHRKEKGTRRPQTGYGHAAPTYSGAGPSAAYATDTTTDPATDPLADPSADPATTYDQTAYAAYVPGDDAAHWQQYSREPRPRNPRKRGPKLFLFTIALIALAEGVLGVVDLAGVPVVGSAYPALALGITAAMLIVGSFWGRAGGLIAVGLVAAVATAGATIGNNIDEDDRFYAPASAGEVQEQYEFGGGRFILDLSEVSDIEALDGRDVAIEGLGGRIEVIVPDGMDVDVRTQVVGGDSRVFDQRSDGFDITQNGFLDGGDDVPDMSITIDLVGGEILVREAA
ncbi:MAG TPA: PspC domain-containing protein [Nocardioides sp.]|nr:PspC domain-containing protein [Nocardioides sp.]